MICTRTSNKQKLNTKSLTESGVVLVEKVSSDSNQKLFSHAKERACRHSKRVNFSEEVQIKTYADVVNSGPLKSEETHVLKKPMTKMKNK